MTRAATLGLTLGAIGSLWLHGFVCLAQDEQSKTPDSTSNERRPLDLKTDPRLKVPITKNLKTPKARELLDTLENATGLKFSANEMVETNEEAFGSLSFRNVPAWVVMQEVAKSNAVKGRWEKTDDGYMLIGTLDAKAQETRVVEIKKSAPVLAKQTPEPPVGSSNQFWIFLAVIAMPGVLVGVVYAVRRMRKRTT